MKFFLRETESWSAVNKSKLHKTEKVSFIIEPSDNRYNSDLVCMVLEILTSLLFCLAGFLFCKYIILYYIITCLSLFHTLTYTRLPNKRRVTLIYVHILKEIPPTHFSHVHNKHFCFTIICFSPLKWTMFPINICLTYVFQPTLLLDNSDGCLPTARRLPDNCQTILLQLLNDCILE